MPEESREQAMERLLIEQVYRFRWVRAEAYPGPFVRPEREVDEWLKEVEELLHLERAVHD